MKKYLALLCCLAIFVSGCDYHQTIDGGTIDDKHKARNVVLRDIGIIGDVIEVEEVGSNLRNVAYAVTYETDDKSLYCVYVLTAGQLIVFKDFKQCPTDNLEEVFEQIDKMLDDESIIFV